MGQEQPNLTPGEGEATEGSLQCYSGLSPAFPGEMTQAPLSPHCLCPQAAPPQSCEGFREDRGRERDRHLPFEHSNVLAFLPLKRKKAVYFF